MQWKSTEVNGNGLDTRQDKDRDQNRRTHWTGILKGAQIEQYEDQSKENT